MRFVHLMSAAVAALISTAHIVSAEGSAESLTPFAGPSPVRIDIADVTDDWLAGFMLRSGMFDRNLVRMSYFSERNPIRLERAKEEYRQELHRMGRVVSLDTVIDFPPMPVRLNTNDYNVEYKSFAIEVPGLVTPWMIECYRASEDRGLLPPTIHVTYPPDLSAYLGDNGWGPGGVRAEKPGEAFARAIVDGSKLDDQGRPCEPFRATVNNVLLVPIPADEAEAFFDAGFNNEPGADPGLTVQVSCSPTLVLSRKNATSDDVYPYQIYCPLTKLVVRYGYDGEIIYEANWDSQNYYYEATGDVVYVPGMYLEDYPFSRHSFTTLPYRITLERCGSYASFKHHWRHDNNVLMFNHRGVSVDYSHIEITTVDSVSEVCTNNQVMIGKEVRLAWFRR